MRRNRKAKSNEADSGFAQVRSGADLSPKRSPGEPVWPPARGNCMRMKGLPNSSSNSKNCPMRSLITVFVIAAFAAAPLVRGADPTPTPSPTAAATPAKKHHGKKSNAAAAGENATPAAANSSVSAPTPASAPAATPAASPSTKKHQAPQPLAQQAAGGGNGLVWVNSESHVYHKEGSKWYGRTKNGKYMSEADAIKEGDHSAKNEK